MTRKALVEELERQYYSVEVAASVSMAASRGGAPPYGRLGNRRPYYPTDVTKWIESRLSDPCGTVGPALKRASGGTTPVGEASVRDQP
jgi:hypothetical protein